ncbi:MAG: tRNA lysidine(34) synthetase TilS [Thermoleophilia bacterium]
MGSDLKARVAEHCRRADLLPGGRPVLAMVSGGADSTCLMHLLAGVHDGPVGVLAVDHGLRPESEGEALAVAAAARALGLEAQVERLGLRPGAGVQERAREARYAAARRVAREGGYARIATGHTASDQAETVLFRLARGTGRAGALGMAARSGDLVRPLLVATAAETRSWCAERGLDVAEDPSNRDPSYARSRVRHGLLPALAEVHGGAEAHVAAFADRLRDEAEVLAPLLDAAWDAAAEGGEGLAVAVLAAQPPAVARLLARRLFERAGLPGEALGAGPVGRALDLLAPGGPRRVDLPGAGAALVERGRLVAVAAPVERPAPAPRPLAVPGAAAFGDLVVSARRGRAEAPRPGRVAVLADGPFTIRAPAPGDRLPVAGGGRRAVGRLLADGGVPARRRSAVPVIAVGDRVVWVAGHRAAADLIAPAGAPAVVLEVMPA